MTRIPRPGPDDYAAYYGRYVERVPAGDLLAFLESQALDLEGLAAQFGDARGGHRYAPGKWSVKDVLGHLVDTERIQACRLLRIARGDTTPLPGFDMDAYVGAAGADQRPMDGLLEEFRAVRRATLALLRGLPEEAWPRRGTANGYHLTAAALAHILAGHVAHHADVLRTAYRP